MEPEVSGDRLKDTEYVLPVCFGTVSFWLGKKASELVSHRWTVYIRGNNNEDLSHVVEKVTFRLHSSFAEPNRVLDTQPFELTETGWGEFDICITLHFHEDVGEPALDLFHRLRLYSDEEGWVQSTKKPVVTEQYEELVFWEPRRAFYNRVSKLPPKPAPESQVIAHFPVHVEEHELAKLKEARGKVQQMADSLRAQIDAQGS